MVLIDTYSDYYFERENLSEDRKCVIAHWHGYYCDGYIFLDYAIKQANFLCNLLNKYISCK